MILTKLVKISISNRNINKYKNLGYICNIGDILNVDLEHVNPYSRSIIIANCDFCGKEKEVTLKKYTTNYNNGGFFSCSKKCSNNKAKLTNIIKYSETHPMKSEEIREKSKKTNLERWGVENVFQNDLIKEKIKKTNLERWGNEIISKNKEILDKIKNTNNQKFGVDFYFKSTDFKEKTKRTNLERWGVESFTKTEEYLEKTKKTNLERWGVEFSLQNDEIKEKSKKTKLENYGCIFYTNREKAKKTNLERWGTEYYTNTEKAKKTNLEKYGVFHPMMNEEFRSKFKIVNDSNYIKYSINNFSIFRCDLGKNHEFEITSSMFSDRKRYKTTLCTICNPIGDLKSFKEKELFKFIKSIYNNRLIQSYRDGLEIDIYLPDLNLGFEFNGLYWHSDQYKDKFYHINKTKHFKERGIRIIHIWEDDWNNKKEILKSQINNWFNISENKIFARKCEVKEVRDSKISTKFLEENHIQGKVGSSLKLGLYYEDELVSLMTFDHYEGRNKMEKDEWNLSRFCNKLNTFVLGGASKLFKYFIKNYEVNRVVSYSDNDWSLGDLYETLGFEKISESNPDYKYIFEGVRTHKSRFRKSKTGISESKLNLLKVYDCGKIKWQYRSN
jgi:hypothetical protein